MKDCCRQYMQAQFGDDEETVAAIYDEYKSSAAEKIAEALAALAARNWNAVDRIAHTLKGNALAVGDAEMADTAIELRKSASLCDEAASAALVEKLRMLEAGL